MPSDPRVSRALASLAIPIGQYRTAVATTLEEIRGYLTAGRSDAEARAERLRDQLGPFAGGRIDAARLASILGEGPSLDAPALRRLERAAEALRSIFTAGDDLFHVDVPLEGGLVQRVSSHLATIGRAFAAARIAAAARRGAASGLDEDVALHAFPFGEWSPAERNIAPPVVVTVDGIDLTAAALAPYLDGVQKIVLIVDGDCAPAPLVRLITPSALVIQACDAAELDMLSDWPGMAVGALVPESAARFVHDPAAGSEPWQRLKIQIPSEARIARVNGLTAAQQKEELHQLQMLASPPRAAAATDAPAGAAAEPADRLAAWLLQQAGLTSPPQGA